MASTAPVKVEPREQSVIKDETRQKLGLLTPEELAVTLKVTTTTLQTWRCEGQGPQYIKLGKQVFYRLIDVKDWINTHTPGGKDEADSEQAPSAEAQVG